MEEVSPVVRERQGSDFIAGHCDQAFRNKSGKDYIAAFGREPLLVALKVALAHRAMLPDSSQDAPHRFAANGAFNAVALPAERLHAQAHAL